MILESDHGRRSIYRQRAADVTGRPREVLAPYYQYTMWYILNVPGRNNYEIRRIEPTIVLVAIILVIDYTMPDLCRARLSWSAEPRKEGTQKKIMSITSEASSVLDLARFLPKASI